MDYIDSAIKNVVAQKAIELIDTEALAEEVAKTFTSQFKKSIKTANFMDTEYVEEVLIESVDWQSIGKDLGKQFTKLIKEGI